ncbi:MAG: hypothetical protein IPL49_03220 [Saprospirales bacterium]|nr:hypothetical protein [Saprospirales bacterium]
MKTRLFSLIFIALLFSWSSLSGQNNALDFDGDGDYITLTPINGFPTGPVSDFTVEMWFISKATGITPTDCSSGFKRLFALGDASNQTLFEVGECNGFLSVFWFTNPAANLVQMTTTIRDNQWHCLSVVRSASNLDVWLDGNVVLNDPTIAGTHNISTFVVGHGLANGFNPTPGEDWLGGIDEVKLWDFALSPAQLTACSSCVLTGAEAGLVAYWQFDQGVAGFNNTSITQALDATTNSNNGTLHPSTANPDHGFILMGPTSNFVSSGAALVYPNYNNLFLSIDDPFQLIGIPWICNGDAVHFSLFDTNLNTPQPAGGVTVDWYYSDDAWLNSTQIPSLSGFQFVVPANGATLVNCPNNPFGYVDREFRAIITVTNGNGTCMYTSQSAQLRIYCEVTQADVTILTSPISPPLCEGDQVTFNVMVNTNLPYPGPTNDVHIDWEMSTGGPWTSLSQYADQSGFTYPPTGTFTVGTQDVCFRATVSNQACASLTGQKCVHVDPNPVCGSITGWPIPTPTNLTLISTTPWLIYEICPGEAAALEIDPSTSFQNCNPQWQYSFTPPSSWIDLGFTNPVQNTNILPTSSWGSYTSIYYQIQCNPLSNPSGCDPCLSNLIEIRLKPTLPIPVIAAVPSTQTICNGDMITLYSSNDPGTIQTTWYCNGEVIGTGPSVPVYKQACYWSEATNGCSTVKSDTFCLKVCTATAKITCPDDNPCIIPNVPITINGLFSFSDCGPIIQYDWEVEFLPDPPGPIYFFSGPTITFTPPAGGAIVTLTVIDAYGCSHSTQAFFKPCQP